MGNKYLEKIATNRAGREALSRMKFTEELPLHQQKYLARYGAGKPLPPEEASGNIFGSTKSERRLDRFTSWMLRPERSPIPGPIPPQPKAKKSRPSLELTKALKEDGVLKPLDLSVGNAPVGNNKPKGTEGSNKYLLAALAGGGVLAAGGGAGLYALHNKQKRELEEARAKREA